jgi:hypothetical protein
VTGLRRNYLKRFGISNVNDLYVSRLEKQLRIFWNHTGGKDVSGDTEISRLLDELSGSIRDKVAPIIDKWLLL